MLSDADINLKDLELISSLGLFAFLPRSYEEDIKKDIKASFTKYTMGFKSHDYTKNKYFSSEGNSNNQNPYQVLLDKITFSIEDILDDIYGSFHKIKLKEETAITLGLFSTFSRLTNSYEASLFLLRNKYYFESMALNRMIFEQINFCFNLSHLSTEDFNSKSKKKLRYKLRSTDINKLKKFLPDSKIGNFYSFLSEIAHIDFRQVSRYLEYDQALDGHILTIKSIAQSIESALVMLKIVDIHLLVYEFCFKGISNLELTNLTIYEKSIDINPERKSKKLLKRFNHDFLELQKIEQVPIKIRDEFQKNENSDLPF